METVLNPARHTTPFRFFVVVNKPELKWIALIVLFYGIGSVAILITSYFLGRTIDALTLNTGENITTLLVLLLVFVACHELFYRLGHICEVFVLARVRNRTKKALFDHTASLSFGYFADRFAGEIAHKIAGTADAFERLVVITTNYIMENSVFFVFSAITLGVVHSAYGAFMAVWVAGFIVGAWAIAKRMERQAGVYAAAEAKTTGALVDVYGNISAVKVYGGARNLKTAHERVDAETTAFLSLGKWDVLTFHYQGIFLILLWVGFVGVSAWLYGRALITLGQVVFIAGVALRFVEMIWSVGKNLADFIRFRGEAMQNLSDLVVAPAIVDGAHAGAARQSKVRVEYRDATFGYLHEQPILENFSIAVRAGEKIGIVGLSGAGKTTFANLLLRFFDVQRGEILLNGMNIQNFTQEFLRSHISFISQDTPLFHATIAENIAYGSPAASPADVERAAKLAYADDFIADLPQGYESVVGERGVKLSGGQRQRIAIARALLADRPLFLLDEATSALDSESEGKIQKGLAALMEQKTVIAIAHRLSTLSHMDRIVFLEGGKIVEDGTHAELLAREGKYAKLWRLQAGGFLPSVANI
ncbi:MAG: ABC transporter ATP-binding protein [Candidatus Liptonbacteria bacterium]|nr:ABC transporter ATP-binding protein [Candidatus Liptonbacteria bacterium]